MHVGGKERKIQRFDGKPRKRAHLEDLDVYDTTIIKQTLQSWTGFTGRIL